MIIGNCVSSARPVHKLSFSHSWLSVSPLLLSLLLPLACMGTPNTSVCSLTKDRLLFFSLSSTFIQEWWTITVRKLLNIIIRITTKKQRIPKKHKAKCAEVLTKTYLLPPLHHYTPEVFFSSSILQPLDHDPKNKTETKKIQWFWLGESPISGQIHCTHGKGLRLHRQLCTTLYVCI